MTYLHCSPKQLDPETWETSAYVTDEGGNNWRVIVEWVSFAGRREPSRVDIRSEGRPVVAEVLRRLPLATIFVDMQRHAEDLLLRISRGPGPGSNGLAENDPEPTDNPEWRAAYRAAASTFGVQRGRRLSGPLLEEVAAIYRAAYADRRPVTKAVAQQMGCSTSTAGKRIMAARKAGLLEGVGPQ